MSRLLVAVLLALAAPRALAASPRWGAFDISAQTYRPDIDSEFSLATGAKGPFERIYGTSRGWMLQAGVSRALYTGFGSLELGVRTGWFQKSGKAIVEATGAPSGVETSLKIVPSSVALTYRLDFVPDRWHVPLAPYGRATLERYNWWVTNGSGGTAESGATNGWSVTGGVGFLLDFLDPMLARELDADSGVNHTYVFIEVTKAKIDDFGGSKSWDLSSDKVSIGAGLMFVF